MSKVNQKRENKDVMRCKLTIGIVGAGGDGVIVLGTFLQRLAASQGYFSQMPRYYGAQIRGGASAIKLGLDAEHLSLPEDSADIIVCFDREKYQELEQELSLGVDTLLLCDSEPAREFSLPEKSFMVGFSDKSKKVTGATRNKNIVALGLLTRILGLPESEVNKTIADDEELALLRENLPSIDAGRHLFDEFPFPELRLSPPQDHFPKTILHGNTAVALAAANIDCQAFFGYPITPSAEIMQEMQEHFARIGGVFLQAEDEIASVGMFLGASMAGAKSIMATSGPGLDLMTEMIGLASAAEIPMVIVDVQRGGPSTGIPSKSEQSDLNHAIYGGHGDAPRVVIAPCDVEECYRLTIESVNIAHYFQTPVILLSDQWLGQTLVATNSEFLKKDHPGVKIKKPPKEGFEHYRRHRLTEDFISPMAVVGDEGLVYQTTGLTHDEMGAPAFDFETHQRMHEKRWKKLLPLRQRDDLVKIVGEQEQRTGIITWGSSTQIVLGIVQDLGLQQKVKVCVPELIHPLPRSVDSFLGSVEKLLVIEMSYSGQFYRYLRSQLDLPEKTKVYNRAGGRHFTRKELTEPILEAVR